MASKLDGEVIKQVFYMIAKDPLPVTQTLDLPTLRTRDCCSAFALRALADTSSSDPLKNDVSGFGYWLDPVISSVTMTLEKYDATISDYDDVDTLNDNTFGTFYALGSYVNDDNLNFIGYQLNWKDVLTAYGAGSYKVKLAITTALSGTGSIWSNEYCLKQYTPQLANGTVRIEYWRNNIMGDPSDDTLRIDWNEINWYNSVRLPGFFGYGISQYEKDYVQYNNGAREWVKDEQEPEYHFKLKPSPQFIHDMMRVEILQADDILITDYNAKNAGTFIEKSVQCTSGYEPQWKYLQSKLATVELKFRQKNNNLKKLRC